MGGSSGTEKIDDYTIFFEIGTDICNYDLVLEGEDDLGNSVEFTVKFFSE